MVQEIHHIDYEGSEVVSCLHLVELWLGEGAGDGVTYKDGKLVSRTKLTEKDAEAFIAKQLFKHTDCGVSFSADSTGIHVAGYAEGSEHELPVYSLEWETFTVGTFEYTVEKADWEGSYEWDYVNGTLEEEEEEEELEDEEGWQYSPPTPKKF